MTAPQPAAPPAPAPARRTLTQRAVSALTATGRVAAGARKALAAVVAMAAYGVAAGLLHGNALTIASAVIGAAGAAGVYAVPNGPRS